MPSSEEETQTTVSQSSRERVAEFQRKRILEATVQLIAERGLRRVTTLSVVKRAGVSRRTLNNLFGSIDDCAVTAVALVRRRAMSLVSEAFEREAEWTDGVLTGLAALLDFLDCEPQLAWVCLVETLTVSRAGLSLRAHELAALAPLVDAGRVHATPGELPHPLTAEATIASVASILHNRLVTGEAPPFIDLLAPLASLVLSLYLGGDSLQKALDRAEDVARSIATVERSPYSPSTPAHTHTWRSQRRYAALTHTESARACCTSPITGGRATRRSHGRLESATRVKSRLYSLAWSGTACSPNAPREWAVRANGG
jgi:AcrR family transcriptional regulator